MEDWKSQFRTWLKEICPWGESLNCIQWIRGEDLGMVTLRKDEPDPEQLMTVNVYTHDYCYNITTHDGEYLGCQVSCRKPRAGEDWTRGNDLPDGKFSKETWDKIKDAIIAYELVKIVKPKRQPPTPEVGPSIGEPVVNSA